jgi:WD40 repeat protein
LERVEKIKILNFDIELLPYFSQIDLIVTGSKDGSYRVWDTRFNQLPATDPSKRYIVKKKAKMPKLKIHFFR